MAAYEQASYPRAMRGFVEAADALVTEPDNTYVAEFAHNRVLAYRNAAWASLMAHQSELGRELLRGAATHDAECAPEIERILDGILSI